MSNLENREAFDSVEDAAVYFLLEYWTAQRYSSNPPAHLIWSEIRGDQAVAVLGYTSINPAVSIVCDRVSNGWLAISWVHGEGVLKGCCRMDPQHSPAHIYCWKTVDMATRTVLVICRDEERQAPVIDGHVYYAVWGFEQCAKLWQPGHFCVYDGKKLIWDAALQKPWLSKFLATPKDFAQAHQRYHDKKEDKNWWAVNLLFDCTSREQKLDVVRYLIEAAPDFREQKDYLYYIGAGPLEDLMSGWLLDEIEDEISEPKLLTALSCVRMEFESAQLQERFKRLVRPFLSSVHDTYLDAWKICTTQQNLTKTNQTGRVNAQQTNKSRPRNKKTI